MCASLLPMISHAANPDEDKAFYASHIADIEKEWGNSDILSDNSELPTNYALIDIDGDGRQELYLRNENNEDGGLFCYGDGKITSITFEMYKRVLYVYGNKIECGGSVGTGVVYYDGYELQNSRIKQHVTYELEFGFDSDGQPCKSEYYNKKDAAGTVKARMFFAKDIDWQVLRDNVKWYDYGLLKK
jgi:hypothetical protein